MFYLKYRPQKFAELFGLEEISRSLQRALQKGQVAHAYIFTGPKGSGKTTAARILAKAVNCERVAYGQSPVAPDVKRNAKSDLPLPEPCNECSACLAVSDGRFLDLIEIDAASNRGIDDIRQLRDKIKLSPSTGRFKVYIIDEAHMLTPEAFNALLKTLEEPPAHAIFILATTEYHKIPETIRSRCQTFKFRRASRDDIVKKLDFICQQEKVDVAKEKLSKIAELAEGGYRNAETLLEQWLVGEVDFLPNQLLTPEYLLELILGSQTAEALKAVSRTVQNGENAGEFLTRLVIFLRRMLLLKGGISAESLDLSQEEVAAADQISRQLSSRDLIFLLEKCLSTSEREKYSPIPQLPLEMAILELAEYLQSLDPSADRLRDRQKTETFSGEGAEFLENRPVGQKANETESLGEWPLLETTLEQVASRWDDFLKVVKPLNHSLEALLRSARPKEVGRDGLLVIEVFYKFHKEKLSQAQNVNLVQKALGEIFKARARVNFVLGPKKDPAAAASLPASRTISSSGDDLVEAALEAFGS